MPLANSSSIANGKCAYFLLALFFSQAAIHRFIQVGAPPVIIPPLQYCWRQTSAHDLACAEAGSI
jgi:hypothetical protein